MPDFVSVVLAGIGTAFFVVGTVGLIRFPDVYCRLHALTKADNLGLGFIVLSLAVRAESPVLLLKLILIWIFVLVSSATSCYLVARTARQMNIRPYSKGE